jgi:hypothetical protein
MFKGRNHIMIFDHVNTHDNWPIFQRQAWYTFQWQSTNTHLVLIFVKIIFFIMRLQPFSSLLTLLILSQLQPGSFLRLAASEFDDLRLQHQPEYFNSLLKQYLTVVTA